MATLLSQEGHALHVLLVRLLLALDLRRSQHVRVMWGTMATLVHLKGLAFSVLPTRLLLTLGLRRSQHVRVMWDTTAKLVRTEGLAVSAQQAGIRVQRLRMAWRPLCVLRAMSGTQHIREIPRMHLLLQV
jgi:hypothetical protein